MEVYHGSYLIFYIFDKNFKVKEIITRILIIPMFVCSHFVAIKLAVETACSCKGKF